MAPGDYDTFCYLNGMGLYGVFSHFIHPDDIFDLDRGKGQSWEDLYESYCEMMADLHRTYPWLRSLTVTDAGDALRVREAARPRLEYGETELKGSCEAFYGEAYFYLRTEKTPLAVNDSCQIVPASTAGDALYYLVTVKEPDFIIKLVNQ